MKFVCLAAIAMMGAAASGQDTFSWRYYRPSNTGIQGDFCEALIVDQDSNPWIAGYDASFEEGGIAKFLQAENRWMNVSNVDYPAIGHPELTGISRVSDIARDSQGRFWMATGRGGLFFDPAVGPTSLRRFGDDNSPIPGGWNRGVEVAPDGTVWFSSYATVWGTGGIAKYTPATNQWQVFPNYGGGSLAIQPKPGGGYFVWTQGSGEMARFDSGSQVWVTFSIADGNPYYLVGKNNTDSQGNVWMYRWTNATMLEAQLDLRRPNGTWFGLPKAPFDGTFNSAAAIRTKNGQTYVADGGGEVWRFNGSGWISLGHWQQTTYSQDIDFDDFGNVWACGMGGAARYDAGTGTWQRYRITNTSQYDFFNNDLTIDPAGGIYACANAGPGYGGMVKFDGVRWTGFNNHHYGLGVDWPFPTDNSHRVYMRPSNGELILNPMFNGLYSFMAGSFTNLNLGADTIGDALEDSLGRLWVTTFGNVMIRNGAGWTPVLNTGEFKLRRDPSRSGTIWAMGDTSITRTNGTTTLFRREVSDFPELDPQSDQFKGLVVANDGTVWIGAYTVNLPDNSVVFHLNPTTGAYVAYRKTLGWPFPGEYVQPLAATPDGKIWMQYDSDFLTAQRGMFWFDGTNVGTFPAPPNGEPQWGGLPHAGIVDMEVKPIFSGYELWMSCASRGIAVLTVTNATHAVTGWVKQSGTAVAGATVKLMQGATTVATSSIDAAGNYRFDTAPGGYTIVPIHPDKLFFPATRLIQVSGPILGQNFTAANIGPVSITWQYQGVVYSDQSRMGTLGLNAITPVARDITMSDDSLKLTSPIKVTIPAGERTATFFVYGVTVAADTLCTVTARHQGLTAAASIIVRPKPVVTSVTLASMTVKGGRGVAGRATLDKPAIGPMAMTLSSSNPSVATVSPSPTAVSNGTSTKDFYCRTYPVTSSQVVSISATFYGSTQSATLTVTP